MNRIKIDRDGNEGDSFYSVDQVYLGGQDSEIKKLINEARKEAYVRGFNRGQSRAYSGFWNESCQKLFKEDEENRKRDEHEHCWTAHDKWQEHIARTAFNLAASAYEEYVGGKSSVEDAMDAVVAVLRTEFVNTREKQVAENDGKMIPVPPEEKWLTDMENESKGVSMLSIARDFIKKGRKEGYDVGYLKGYMAAQSKEQGNETLEPGSH